MTPIENPAVAGAFQRFPDGIRAKLLELRDLIYDVAAATEGVGKLLETLKWGQPSYLTTETKSGSTLRLGATKDGRHAGLYVHCQTDILTSFQDRFPTAFNYQGRRGILFGEGDDLQAQKLRACIAHGLTYHLRKSRR